MRSYLKTEDRELTARCERVATKIGVEPVRVHRSPDPDPLPALLDGQKDGRLLLIPVGYPDERIDAAVAMLLLGKSEQERFGGELRLLSVGVVATLSPGVYTEFINPAANSGMWAVIFGVWSALAFIATVCAGVAVWRRHDAKERGNDRLVADLYGTDVVTSILGSPATTTAGDRREPTWATTGFERPVHRAKELAKAA